MALRVALVVPMRALGLATLVLLASLVVPAPAAMAQEGGAHFYEDAAKDTELETFGVPAPPVPVDSAETAPADLAFLDVVETDDAVSFTLGVQSLTTTSPHTVSYTITFRWHKVDYNLQCQRTSLGAADVSRGGWCSINAYSEDEGYLDGANLEATWDATANTISLPVRKVLILDAEDRMPTKGDTLSDLSVRSQLLLGAFGFFTRVRDVMPEAGAKGLMLAIGDVAKGHMSLTSEDRVRVSNGGATTFVFQANLTNTAEIEDTVDLATDALPPGYNVTLRTPIRVPAEGSARLAVLVSVPFGHDHGGYSAFNVTAKSQRDAGSYASLRLGVLHTPIPLPAGHHDELYLHAARSASGAFESVVSSGWPMMNTEPPTEQDAPEAAPTEGTGGGVEWHIPLTPTLGMGLDFEVAKAGELVGKIKSRVQGDASLTAELYLVETEEEEDDFRGRYQRFDLQDGILLADGRMAALAMPTNGDVAFNVPLTPTPESDYVPYAPRQNLVLRLALNMEGAGSICCIDGTTPTLTTKDFLMKLPLNEYHDRLTGVAEAALAIDLKADGEVERYGRPGTVVTYAFDLTNPLGRDLDMEVDVAGGHADTATIVPDGVVKVPSKGSVRVTLAVQVPFKAEEEQELEVLVFAHAVEDPSLMAIARTKTIVTRGSDAAPDETEVLIKAQQEAADNDSPGLGTLAALGAVGAAALVYGRRRRG